MLIKLENHVHLKILKVLRAFQLLGMVGMKQLDITCTMMWRTPGNQFSVSL